ETKEGEKRTSIELEVDEIGPSLRYATAQVTRSASSGGASGGQMGHRSGAAPVADEPWGAPASAAPASGGDVWNTPGTFSDDTPF
ncbi:MAG: single-stranded DNA-binding protein, partial [Microcella sp.]|nr:single-stranded DNA-binding protein [Microcella sp.]